MSQRSLNRTEAPDTSEAEPGCPSWCVAPHGVHHGEEDWVHLSEPLALTANLQARLCMTVDPATSVADGPHVVIGSTELTQTELTPAEANAVGLAIQALASAAEATPTVTRRAGA